MFIVCSSSLKPKSRDNADSRHTGTTCQLLSSSTSTSSPWICAWNTGSALNNPSVSATINQHGTNSYRQFTFDLSSASIADTNPFVSSTASPTATNTGSSPSSTPTDDHGNDSGNDSGKGGNDSGNSGSTGGNSGSTVVGTSFKVITDYQTAHGVIMGCVMVLLFPLGAIFMRLGASAWLHGAWQIFALAAMLCGFGLGIKLGQMRDLVSSSPLFLLDEKAKSNGNIALQINRPNPHRLRHRPNRPLPPPTLPRPCPPPAIPPHRRPHSRLPFTHLVRPRSHGLRHRERWPRTQTSGEY